VAEQPDNLVLEILRGLRAEIVDMKAQMATKADLNSLRADMASDMLKMQADISNLHKDTREQIASVRRAVIEYHSSVVGHGMLISDLDERVRRIELRLDMPPPGSH
jgi:hypothetical protein